MNATSPRQLSVGASIGGIIGILGGIASIAFGPNPWNYIFFGGAIAMSMVVALVWYLARPSVAIGYAREFGGLLDEVAGTSEVWLMLFTASRVTVEDFWGRYKGKITLVLAHPDAPFLQALHDSCCSLGIEKLQADIRAATRKAKDNGADVRWTRWSFPGSLVIANPDAPGEGWARVESALAGLNVEERISIKAYEAKNRRLYRQLRASFLATLKAAEVAPE